MGQKTLTKGFWRLKNGTIWVTLVTLELISKYLNNYNFENFCEKPEALEITSIPFLGLQKTCFEKHDF